MGPGQDKKRTFALVSSGSLLEKAIAEQLLPQPTPDLPEDMGTDLKSDKYTKGLNKDHRDIPTPNYLNVPDHSVTVYRSENNRPIGAIAKKLPPEANFNHSDVANVAAHNLYATHKAEHKPGDPVLTRRELRAAARAAVKRIAKSQKEFLRESEKSGS